MKDSLFEKGARKEEDSGESGLDRRTFLSFMVGAAATAVLPEEAKAQQAPAETILPKEDVGTIERITGMPYGEFSERFNARIKIPVPRGGKYIIHIRQMHQHARDQQKKVSGQPEVVDAQRSIATLIESVARAGRLEGVFAEGFSERDGPQRYKNAIRNIEAFISGLEKRAIFTAGDAEKTYEDFARVHKVSLNNQIFYHYTMNSVRALSGTLRAKFAKIAPQDIAGRTLLAELDAKLSALGAQRTDLEVPEPYTEGAEFKLFMDGKLENIYPPEDRSTNLRAIHAMQEYERALKDFASGKIQTRELAERKVAYQDAAFTKRDPIILEKMEEQDRELTAAGRSPENLVVVFGAAHDFESAVREKNKTASHAGYGLVELWSKNLKR